MKYERDKDSSKILADQLHLIGNKAELKQDGNTCYILFLKAGTLNIVCSDHSETLNAGNALLLGKDCHCTLQASGHITPEAVWCAFPQSFVHEMRMALQKEYLDIFDKPSPTVLYGSVQFGNRLRTLLELMRSAAEEPDYPDKLYLALVLHYIKSAYQAQSSNTRPQNDTVERICTYLSENYTQKLTLSEVAAQFYLSPYYLSRLFRRVTGQSIVDYINNRRIEAAQRLLEETDLSINDVAEQTGFSTAAHFRRVFRDLLGVGPHQYRKDHSQNRNEE
jgi:AraC-like DNA-binding protein